MNRIQGMLEDFKHAKIVYLVTFSKKGERHSRPMTNFNEDPYGMIWFPTYRDTRKVDDIKHDPRVLVIFPSSNDGKFYEIEGKAEFENQAATNLKWKWWYLYWHPEMSDHFWFSGTGEHPERVIINIFPESAKITEKDQLKITNTPSKSLEVK